MLLPYLGIPDSRNDALGVGAIIMLSGIKLYRPQGAVAVTLEQETTRPRERFEFQPRWRLIAPPGSYPRHTGAPPSVTKVH